MKRSYKKRESEKNVAIGYYAILYMDVLNQSEKLSKVDRLPETDEGRESFITLLKDTYGVIDGFERLFESYLSQTRSRTAPSNIPKAYRETFKRVVGGAIGKTLLSDSMLYYVSLNEGKGAVPTIRILDLMYAASAVIGGGLAAGHPSRGGFDVGIAATLPRVGIYGHGLCKAYALESQAAQYPRIAIGSELLDYLSASSRNPNQNQESDLTRVFAKRCLSLVYVDTDGVPALDFAGKAIRELYPDWKNVISEAVVYAKSELERFKKEANDKLASRYSRLMNYLIDREKRYWT